MLSPDSDILSPAGIGAYLPSGAGVSVYTCKTVGSTNDEAKKAVAAGLTGEAIFAADEQTAGRGRRGRSFYSPKGSGLYFTAVLRTGQSLWDAAAITTAAAVAAAKAINAISASEARIKWVNDVFVDGKKVCGILTEAVTDLESGGVNALIVGIGVNLRTSSSPEELSGIAGNAAEGQNVIRCRLAAEIFTRLKNYCDRLPDKSYMDDYRAMSAVIGKTVAFERDGKEYEAAALDILDDGGLVCRTAEGDITLRSGEVSVKLK